MMPILYLRPMLTLDFVKRQHLSRSIENCDNYLHWTQSTYQFNLTVLRGYVKLGVSSQIGTGWIN